MLNNIIGELKMLKELNIKPNFSDLSRKYGVDRHIIKKYYDNDGKSFHQARAKTSIWDLYHDEIKELYDNPGITKRAIYMYLSNKYSDRNLGTYSGFRSYTLRKGFKSKKINTKPHVLFETNPREQIQVDWKESLQMILINGEIIEFYVLSATLGYSREHVFIYSPNKS